MRQNTAETFPMIAALDLGSNSFHMVVARLEDHALTIIDRERDMVRLAGGMDRNNLLTEAASERALACLARFGERLRGLDPNNVRVVGTNALRKANNSREFIARAEQALGFSIEILSGIEEARLVFLGHSKSIAVKGIANQATIPRGSPNPKTALCLNW